MEGGELIAVAVGVAIGQDHEPREASGTGHRSRGPEIIGSHRCLGDPIGRSRRADAMIVSIHKFFLGW